MSLGLVAADFNSIYLVTESEGIQCQSIPSKICKLQEDPDFAIVVTGGLEHWHAVFDSYAKQISLKKACDEIVLLLDKLTPTNQAYGLLCGYEDGRPICYRIERELGFAAAAWHKAPLTSVQVIGHPAHAESARCDAETMISKGMNREEALRKAIQSRIPGQYIRGPIESLHLTMNLK